MGPLQGIRVVEFAALGPAPMGAMLLADLGAEVLRIERKPEPGAEAVADLFDPAVDVLRRNRQVVALDLKRPEGIAAALHLLGAADALIEGFRPGVMERLGLGPDVCLARNPRLVYARMTGWGQHGPLAQSAGHDIDYLALSGALHAIGERGAKPQVPLNLVADGSGALFLAMGVLAALVEASRSGLGQVVDVAMTDGCATLMSMIHTLKAMGQWTGERGANLLDGGAPFYDSYRCGDGRYLAVGAIEPRFYALFLERTGLAADPDFAAQWDRTRWPALKARVAAVIARRSRDDWCALFEGSDACVAPVLDMDEAPRHPHNRARGTFVDIGGVMQAAPAPRFSRTATPTPSPTPAAPPDDPTQVLARWGCSAPDIARLRACGAI